MTGDVLPMRTCCAYTLITTRQSHSSASGDRIVRLIVSMKGTRRNLKRVQNQSKLNCFTRISDAISGRMLMYIVERSEIFIMCMSCDSHLWGYTTLRKNNKEGRWPPSGGNTNPGETLGIAIQRGRGDRTPNHAYLYSISFIGFLGPW